MEMNFATFAVLAFACYRITRFLIFDSMFGGTREKMYVGLANASDGPKRFRAALANKALEGLSCTWCLGVWVTVAVYWLYRSTPPHEWGRHGWIAFAGIAGLQGLLHSYEPGDDDD